MFFNLSIVLDADGDLHLNPLSSYRHRYRLHQAYSQYPRLNFAADIASTICLTGLVATVAWFGYTLTTYQANSRPVSPDIASTLSPQVAVNQNDKLGTQITESVAKAAKTESVITAANKNTGEVEIPAAATIAANGNSATGNNSVFSFPQREGKIYESDWIFLLPADKYIIQFGSSANRDLLYAEANAFPTGPIAIYPFMKSATSRIVYGYSSGVYNSRQEATRALEILPREAVTNSPWIRPVGALQKQIKELSIDS